jgi:hypothetical protein
MKPVCSSASVSALNLCQDLKNDRRDDVIAPVPVPSQRKESTEEEPTTQKANLGHQYSTLRTMTVGEVWDADQLMGKTPYKGFTLDKSGRDSKGVVQPHCWGLPGFLSPSDYDCFGEFVSIISSAYLTVLYGRMTPAMAPMAGIRRNERWYWKSANND